jgi:uncharacterized protein with PIN domain
MEYYTPIAQINSKHNAFQAVSLGRLKMTGNNSEKSRSSACNRELKKIENENFQTENCGKAKWGY